jgi:mycothiol synthase
MGGNNKRRCGRSLGAIIQQILFNGRKINGPGHIFWLAEIAFLACQRPLSACTIMDRIGAADNPVCVNGIQTPSRWPLLPCVRLSSTRFDAAAQSTAVSTSAPPAASILNSLGCCSKEHIISRRRPCMIDIAYAPRITGLSFRHFRGGSDYSQIAAVLIASEAADNVERNVKADDIASAYKQLNNCDPFKDIVIAEVSGEIIGYARGWWETDTVSGRLYHHNGFLVPEWRRKGIGTALLLWMENHLREIARTHHSEGTSYYQISVTQFQTGTAAMLNRTGYQPARYFYEMIRPSLEAIVEFPLPSGLEIRPVVSADYQAIWKSIDDTSKDEWGYKEPTDGDYQEWLASPHFQPQLWQVAWDIATNQIAGHVLTFIDDDENKQFNRKRGYTEGIGVDLSWRRRGVARALISRSLQAQKSAGMRESALAADSESTSNVVQLYESCGFQIVKHDTIYRKHF